MSFQIFETNSISPTEFGTNFALLPPKDQLVETIQHLDKNQASQDVILMSVVAGGYLITNREIENSLSSTQLIKPIAGEVTNIVLGHDTQLGLNRLVKVLGLTEVGQSTTLHFQLSTDNVATAIALTTIEATGVFIKIALGGATAGTQVLVVASALAQFGHAIVQAQYVSPTVLLFTILKQATPTL